MSEDKRIGDVLTVNEYRKIRDDIDKSPPQIGDNHHTIRNLDTFEQAMQVIDLTIQVLQEQRAKLNLEIYKMQEHKKLIESKMGGKNE